MSAVNSFIFVDNLLLNYESFILFLVWQELFKNQKQVLNFVFIY